MLPIKWLHTILLSENCCDGIIRWPSTYYSEHSAHVQEPQSKLMSITAFKENVCRQLMGTVRQVGRHHLQESEVFIGLRKNKRGQRKICIVCFKNATPRVVLGKHFFISQLYCYKLFITKPNYLCKIFNQSDHADENVHQLLVDIEDRVLFRYTPPPHFFLLFFCFKLMKFIGV